MNAAQRAMELLGTWPDLLSTVPTCGAGQGLRTTDAEIVHFHGEHDADLHLTGPVIRRLYPGLSQSTAIRLRPGSSWVTVHLDCDDDIDLLTSLISVALQAHASAWPRPIAMPCSQCHTMVTPEHRATPATAGTGSRFRRRNRRSRDGE
ncbi:luciferase family protein [Streptomyces sp. Tue6028]|uniref:luciferase domain-containing protein n=1 Tax=Streptomyces sp. Tue6028 TaxID=2036037 RepID=UPI003EB6FCF4